MASSGNVVFSVAYKENASNNSRKHSCMYVVGNQDLATVAPVLREDNPGNN